MNIARSELVELSNGRNLSALGDFAVKLSSSVFVRAALGVVVAKSTFVICGSIRSRNLCFLGFLMFQIAS